MANSKVENRLEALEYEVKELRSQMNELLQAAGKPARNQRKPPVG
ncbi:hypothetical protein [Novosphingobium sp. 9]|nr:hypothetical protein [Novosphingobium sp. 9]